MNFELTDEQRELVAAASAIAAAEYGPARTRLDIPTGVSHVAMKSFAKQGLAGISVSEANGGQGGSLIDSVLVIEAAARVNPIAGDVVQALNFGAIQQLAHAGDDEQKDRFLAPLLAGEAMTAVAMTETGAGSATSELATRAHFEGDNVRVSGSKIFTTHGADADFFVVWARFGDDRASIGSVVVERGRPGFTVDSNGSFLSGEHYGMLFMDNCLVPRGNVLIDRDGFRRLFSVFNIERLGNASRSLALGQLALDLAVEHGTSRVQFGQPIIEHQGLRWRLAEVATAIESARLLLYRAATTLVDGLPRPTNTAMAKLACNRAGHAAADFALQVLGGSGFDSDSIAGYLLHRTRGWLIAGGTAEQMLDQVGKGVVKAGRSR